jgi:alkylated DNA repair dioxygenase AlkB
VGQTLSLFSEAASLESLGLPDADIRFMPCFYDNTEAQHHFKLLLGETPWRQDPIKVWGKEHLQPRLTAWYGDAGTDYTYSGLRLEPLVWSAHLLAIKSRIEALSGTHFNSVLINLYRDERDSVGWHSDDEPELGERPVIASLSLGEMRTFKLKHRLRKEEKTVALDLTSGSLLLMGGSTQRYWAHAIEKERAAKGARINLTFRTIHTRRR